MFFENEFTGERTWVMPKIFARGCSGASDEAQTGDAPKPESHSHVVAEAEHVAPTRPWNKLSNVDTSSHVLLYPPAPNVSMFKIRSKTALDAAFQTYKSKAAKFPVGSQVQLTLTFEFVIVESVLYSVYTFY